MNKLYEYMAPDRGGFVVESGANGRDIFMKGVFIQADVKNHNQRVYPLNEIDRAIRSINEKLKKGDTVLGELDHPPELNINLDRVSHMITEMWLEGSNGFGKLKILDKTPCGSLARGLLESGVKLGVSSRGSGNVDYNGRVNDFDIVTVDIVAQPSAPNAYPKAIYESLYNMRGGEIIMDVARAASQGDAVASKHLPNMLVNFIHELKK